MKLRLYHHPDGARVAYREAGTGPPVALLHSAGLSHRELEPVVEHLTDRFRVVLPDLPLHGDSEDRPRHPYSPDWLADVIAGFCRETLGPRPLVGGHDAGAELLLRAVTSGRLRPRRLVLMSNRLHGPGPRAGRCCARGGWLAQRGRGAGAGPGDGARRAAALPAPDRLLALGARQPGRRATSCATRSPTSAATATARARGRSSRAAGRWRPSPSCSRPTRRSRCPRCCCGPTRTATTRSPIAEEALARLPDAQLRVLPGTGFLMAYDDPVGLARELAAFCG